MSGYLDSPPIQIRLTKELYSDLQIFAMTDDASLEQEARYAVRLFIFHRKKKLKEAPKVVGG
jgi:hypothetical protein